MALLPTSLLSGPLRLATADGQILPKPILQPTTLRDGNFIFADVGGQGNLRIRPDQGVDLKGGRGVWAQFALSPEEGGAVRFASVGHRAKHGQLRFLEVTNGRLTSGDSGTAFTLVPSDGDASAMDVSDAPEPAAPEPAVPAMVLTDEQKAAFVRDGMLVVRGCVAQAIVDDALRTINAGLGAGAAAWATDDDGNESLRVTGKPVRDLLTASPVLGLAEQLLGPVKGTRRRAQADLSESRAQVALRFPLEPEREKPAKKEWQWHIDGMEKVEHMSGFQLLVGIALSSQPADGCGNLAVWPGEHRRVHEAVGRAYAQRTAEPEAAAASADSWLGHRPNLPLSGKEELKVEPGDVVLCHQRLPHSIGINRSPHIRYQVYFRLQAQDFEPTRAPSRPLFDGWHGLSGHVAGVAPAAGDTSRAA